MSRMNSRNALRSGPSGIRDPWPLARESGTPRQVVTRTRNGWPRVPPPAQTSDLIAYRVSEPAWLTGGRSHRRSVRGGGAVDLVGAAIVCTRSCVRTRCFPNEATEVCAPAGAAECRHCGSGYRPCASAPCVRPPLALLTTTPAGYRSMGGTVAGTMACPELMVALFVLSGSVSAMAGGYQEFSSRPRLSQDQTRKDLRAASMPSKHNAFRIQISTRTFVGNPASVYVRRVRSPSRVVRRPAQCPVHLRPDRSCPAASYVARYPPIYRVL